MGITIKKCVYCNAILTNRKRKYCNDLCQYRYLSIKNNNPKFTKIGKINSRLYLGS